MRILLITIIVDLFDIFGGKIVFKIIEISKDDL